MKRTLFPALQGILLLALLAAPVAGASSPTANSEQSSGAQAEPTGSATAPGAPHTHQEFQDVPQTSPFFNFIRNISRVGIVTGYPCGTPVEPCYAPENLPYYRPGAYVTRAQMAKLVDLARKQPGIYIDTNHPQPLFVRTDASNARAIQGDSIRGNGLHGTSASGTASGVYGENVAGGFGLAGRTGGGGSAIFGDNLNQGGYAGFFNGNVRVVGNMSKGGGSFEIDHPLDPANKYLYHSFVESPDMMNIYNGNITLDEKGEATVQMPSYFEALNREFRYQLTPIGAPGPNLHIAQKIEGNRFKIAGGTPGMEVSWQVTGVRHDPYAEKYRIPVEREKPTDERGYYLHPELYGQPEDLRVTNTLTEK